MALKDLFNLMVKKSEPVSSGDFISKSIESYIRTQSSMPQYNKFDVSIPSITKENCYIMANSNDTLRNVLYVVNRETFKEGYIIKPKFICKCPKCGEEYDRYMEFCEDCNNPTIEPNKLEFDILEAKLNNINRNGENIIKLFKQVETDLNVVDEGYLFFDNDNSIYRFEPITIKPIVNNQGLLGHIENKMLVFNPEKRNKYIAISPDEPIPEGYLTADYESIDHLYYSRTELIRLNKFSEDLRESIPPVVTLWSKLYILNKMDEYLTSWYAGKRASKGILVFNTNNYADMEKQIASQMVEIQKNPQYLMNIITENKDARKLVEYIPLSPNPSELDSESTRDSLRRYIAGFYGVLPLYLGDVTNTGGLNNETQQLTITRDAVLGNVRRYNQVLLDFVNRLDIKDWEVEIKTPDEIEIPRKQSLEKGKLEIAQMKYNLGYNLEYDESIDDWIITDKREIGSNINGLDFGFEDNKG